MLSQQIRRGFLNYFQKQGHTLVPSSPVIPHSDPSLLFINAGMNQFKDVFLGHSQRDYVRATSTQKCIRVGGKHNDLENVGHTSRHLTFFEMLGNFSFGDYFKKEAIRYAWEVSTSIFGFDPERIWASVYMEDEESFALWESYLPSQRIVRMGESENFWAMGDTGPCGPCSELLYDRGPSYTQARSPLEDPSGERYLEFWNLVFMQFSRDGSGQQEPLPRASIDTGAGLERILSLKEGVRSVFETDVLKALMGSIETLSHHSYHPQDSLAPAFHVIADHLRTLAFAIADGVQPSNTDRGYVLRKVLRRAVRYGKMLGFEKPFLASLLPCLLSCMGEDFPELKPSESRIAEILSLEEENFFRTLHRGGQLLGQIIARSHQQEEKISGEDAFKLKDTYGLPLEEIVLIAKDEHLQVDLTRFEELNQEAKEKSRKAQHNTAQTFCSSIYKEFLQKHGPCLFTGYEQLQTHTQLLAILHEGEFVSSLAQGQKATLLLKASPFYAEKGGQVGDTGSLENSNMHFEVTECKAPFPGIIAHEGTLQKGSLKEGEGLQASVHAERRKKIQNNHTATHLLHWALEKTLGSHIKQAGSLVEPSRLRFDFHHHKALSWETLRELEDLINAKIRTNEVVQSYEIPYQTAQKDPQIKQFFGEKYGSQVRVIDIGFSKELCGGTHTHQLGTIGWFKISKEGSIAAGIRRIEAVTAAEAERFLQKEEDLLRALSEKLKTPSSLLVDKVQELLTEQTNLHHKLKMTQKQNRKGLLAECLSQKEQTGPLSYVAQIVDLEPEELASFAEELLQHLQSGVVALGTRNEQRCQLLIAVSPDWVEKGVSAGQLVRKIAPIFQGGGGGKDRLAQAGGKNPAQLPEALQQLKTFLTPS